VIVQKSSLGLAWKWITVQSNVLDKGSLPAGVEVSLCRHLLKEHMGSEEAAEAFASVKVSLHEFKSNAAAIIANDKLVVRVGGQYYPWSVAAPVVLGILTFGQVIMPATDGAIPMECPELVPKSQAAVGTIVPAARGGWNLWPFPLRRPKTPEQSIVPNPLVSRDTLLVASGTAVQSPFVNDLMFQNAYYERPRRNKVRTIIPTSQMLAQMNLKEGKNRITFTFFTRMLGNQQVAFNIWLHLFVLIVCTYQRSVGEKDDLLIRENSELIPALGCQCIGIASSFEFCARLQSCGLPE